MLTLCQSCAKTSSFHLTESPSPSAQKPCSGHPAQGEGGRAGCVCSLPLSPSGGRGLDIMFPFVSPALVLSSQPPPGMPARQPPLPRERSGLTRHIPSNNGPSSVPSHIPPLPTHPSRTMALHSPPVARREDTGTPSMSQLCPLHWLPPSPPHQVRGLLSDSVRGLGLQVLSWPFL